MKKYAMHTGKMHRIPKSPYRMPKQTLKAPKGGAMLPMDAYDHGRPHKKGGMGPRMPMGATI